MSKVFKSGHFKTFVENDEEFSFIVYSCARQLSDSSTFEQMNQLKPDFVMNIGDLHYSATDKTQTNEFIFAYHELFKS